MTGFVIAGAIIMLVATILPIKYFMHMFQLNSYSLVTQFNWYKKNARKVTTNFLVLVLAVVLGLLLESDIAFLVISVIALLLSLTLIEKNTKKKLVYTMRVKRLYVTSYLMLLALIIVGAFNAVSVLGIIISALSYVLIPLIILIANILNKPVEKAVCDYYINDAKKILKSHKNLLTIGITGSFGKTSVKYYLNTLLKAKYNVLMTPESYNTPMGVVKTVRGSLKPYHDIFVCEMGAKKVGEIKELCDIAHPINGIITSIGPQHLETFKSLDNVKSTKFELAHALPEGGMIFVNGNDDNIKDYNYTGNKITYGVTPDCDYYAYDIKVNSKGTTFKVTIDGEECEFRTGIIGRHNVINIMGAIAMAHKLGITLNELKPQVRRLEGAPHRLQLIGKGAVTIIDDAYNSNPSGAKAALDTLALFEGTKILITPGMVELGAMMEECNKEFGSNAAKVCDYIFLVGKQQTKPIYDGIIEAGFDENKVTAFDTLNQALETMYALNTESDKIVLLENDLPDNY